jgi:alpha-mannosidase
MKPAIAHVINHTHWDREWFLTSVYTSRWIPRLIEKLQQLAAANPDFRYLFDGQTLVLEDLAAVAPAYVEQARALISSGALTAGPYYCQPDWQLTGGELLIRNLRLGQEDVRRYGGAMRTGWLVDTFGHISQAPQIHRLFDIDAVYVWRGVPLLTPYFDWIGSDGSQLFAVDLFGGYRNLYGVTHAPEVAVRRLHAEIEKLQPYYPTPDIPLFDGYDLEDNPEDPLRFYAQAAGIDPGVTLREATPASFVQAVAAQGLAPPEVHGELNSGKYGATFPGVFSARIYLKLMAHDCEHLLFQCCEPLAALAWLKGRPYPAAQFEHWTRLLLQNAVHDCICGVSIDEVHDKMVYNYRAAFDAMVAATQDALATVLADFAPGQYAVSTTPFAVDQWQAVDDELVHVQTDGVGAWPVDERLPISRNAEAMTAFTWQNEHYTAAMNGTGTVRIGAAVYGALAVYAESGDTYSNERGGLVGTLTMQGPLTVEERSAQHCVVRFAAGWSDAGHRVDAVVRVHFDRSPLLRWTVEVDSRGTDMSVEMHFVTGIAPGAAGRVAVGMPFDVVTRPVGDTDLLPREAPRELATILLGQRELNVVDTFPFHDFVAVTDGRRTAAILARGLRAYAADVQGVIRLPLRRAVEWLTRADLHNRIGDAGPFFYVPGARCERSERHELAVVCGEFAPESAQMQAINAAFQNPPLLVEVGGHGAQRSWPVLRAEAPLSSLHLYDGALLARLYNPSDQPVQLSQAYRQTDVWGEPGDALAELAPKSIATMQLPAMPAAAPQPAPAAVRWLTPPAWRVGVDATQPDATVLATLAGQAAMLATQAATLTAEMATTDDGIARLRLQHRLYIVQRESAEARLSLLLNQRKLAESEAQRRQSLYEPDPEIAAIGMELNQLRIKRRIFDYVVAAL